MDIATLVVVFLAAFGVSAGVVWVFSKPIDAVLFRLIAEDVAAAWAMYAKFALFVAAFTSGLRLSELEALVGLRLLPAPTPPVPAGKCLLEVYRTVAGALGGASWTLLVFFGATLAAYAAEQVYEGWKAQARQTRLEEHRSGLPAGRF